MNSLVNHVMAGLLLASGTALVANSVPISDPGVDQVAALGKALVCDNQASIGASSKASNMILCGTGVVKLTLGIDVDNLRGSGFRLNYGDVGCWMSDILVDGSYSSLRIEDLKLDVEQPKVFFDERVHELVTRFLGYTPNSLRSIATFQYNRALQIGYLDFYPSEPKYYEPFDSFQRGLQYILSCREEDIVEPGTIQSN